MNKLHTVVLNQKGIVHIFLLLVLVIGLLAGLYLVQTKTNLFPKASVSGPVTPQTSFSLHDPQDFPKIIGQQFETQVWVRSDIDASNLFVAKINFPADKLEVVSIDTTNSFIQSWVENNFDNTNGTISLVGGVPSPGYSTTNQPSSSVMAKIFFRPKISANNVEISFAGNSAIYRNSDNVNILTSKENLIVSISSSSSSPSPTATPTPTPVPTPSPTPAPTGQNWNYQRDYSGIQGNNNITYWAYLKRTSTYTQASFNGTDYIYTGPNSDRNFLIERNKISPSYLAYSVIRWMAPKSGTISLSGYFQRCCTEVGDFNHHPLAIYSVKKGSEKLWEQATENATKYNYNLSTAVSTGDTIEFWIDPNNDSGWDSTWMDFTISFTTSAGQAAINTSNLGLTDLSGLLSDFNKTNGYKQTSDLNLDKVVNTPDFSLMRNALIQNGVVKGN
ncbi:MAG: hypothetical protein Q7R49_07330 [Candidatus Daviesbacteria bacterium]|nr:hypothetical protein [Candidatus Daviesbacteria bacterium]